MDRTRNNPTVIVWVRRALVPVFVAIALAGCAPQFVRVDPAQSNVAIGAGYKAQLPVGWVQWKIPATPEQVALTRDGFAVQRVAVQCVPHANAFNALKKPSSAGALPNDLADLMVADLRARPGLQSLELKSVAPATIAGARAFRVILEQKTVRGLVLRTVTTGFADTTHFCSATYTAPTLHYFERDASTFDTIVASIKK